MPCVRLTIEGPELNPIRLVVLLLHFPPPTTGGLELLFIETAFKFCSTLPLYMRDNLLYFLQGTQDIVHSK